MSLSISNIAWSAEHDDEMYFVLRDANFDGLEIAPTRIFPQKPYEHIAEAQRFAAKLRDKYGLAVSSMQSIWYGRGENLFGSDSERSALIEYTKRAIDFAKAINCGNLVFGCPKNRNVPDGANDHEPIAMDFFSRIAEYAAANGTVIALEPNPSIYGTNFVNTTEQAIELCRKLNLDGFKVNIDVGTMMYNGEPVSLVANNLDYINHIHISEPGLVPIERRELHSQMLSLPFERYMSIEMGYCRELDRVREIIEYIRGLAEKCRQFARRANP